MNTFLRSAILLIVALPATPVVHAGGNEDVAFFENKIRPVLAEHCYSCHSVKAKKPKGKLLLDSAAGLRKGGESGPAIMPGEPDKSLLLRALRHVDPDLKMPPERKLPAAVIADFAAWIKRGAIDPRKEPAAAVADASWEAVFNERRKWWSLQPVRRPNVPNVKNAEWSPQTIDRFILARLEDAGLPPATDADPRTLLRRLSLVLIGLPPSADEAEAFANAWAAAGAPRQALVEAAVDRLLASPHFGERWARHWLDVVRFTETHGNEWNYEVHHAWRYRDYLIRAFNDDVPYDQFVREHIAGDLISAPRWNRRDNFNESIIGTAFYRFGEVNHDDCIDLRQIGYDIADNQIDTLTKTFQATTVACARCHDHKLDAVSMHDYYGLLGILRSSRCVSHTIDGPEANAGTLAAMRGVKAAIRRALAEAWLKEIDPTRIEKALAAVTDDKLPRENPLSLWRQIAAAQKSGSAADAIKKVADDMAREDAERAKFNQESFRVLADFRTGAWPNWQIGGQGLRGAPSQSGAVTIAPNGAPAITAILPAGAYTQALSERLNGTLRSPVLAAGNKYISFQVVGERASAVRLVSNNCQLNYRNFRYLHTDRLQWITFPLPAETDGLRVYAELMTKFDNPKFPDQLGQLGGDKKDYRMPWEQAAADPRSYFGVTHVVVHDQPAPPKAPLAHLRCLFATPAPTTMAELAARYAQRLTAALDAWAADRATDEDAAWLDALVRAGILSNRADHTPRLAELIADYRNLDAKLTTPRIVPGLADAGAGFEQALFVRGDCMKAGEKTPRRFVAALSPAPIASAGSGRLEVASAIASPHNPLTARVLVNRVWHHLFGTGLVRSVDDFGHVGERPSHPELLDDLADQFMREGWSIKRLIRSVAVTRTFRLAHEPSPAQLAADPENRLLGHYPARRMEAEAIRDALLTTSGRLDRTLYGPSIAAYREKEYADRRLFRGPLDGAGRRSIYIKVTLMEPPKFLEVFNFPGGKVTQGRRDVTDTPAQALAMLNDPFVVQQANVWGKRLLERKGDTVEARIAAMFRTALGRPPRPAEADRFMRFVAQVADVHGVPARDTVSSAAVWRDVGHAVFNMREFITIP